MQYRISFVKSYQEIEDNMKNGKMSALLTMEEGEEEVSRIEDMVKHVLYIRDLAGIDCIGLGADFDGELEIASPEDLPLL